MEYSTSRLCKVNILNKACFPVSLGTFLIRNMSSIMVYTPKVNRMCPDLGKSMLSPVS